ncbi:hypothetical protein C1645_228267 [Glomus cerebriforme]|uniref:Uncharacterized protein n=1 Tax=Glomus cerebriforme TaxID=658196 RepID=A0A397TMV6_9GLOM|nr:hypothetical protein C1645_228267 [Glomus cerebriforme]
MADGRLLIELLEDLTKSQNDDGQKHDALLEHCLGASESDLDEFLEDISSSLITYLPTLQIFISHLYKKFLKASPSLNLQARWKTSLDKFVSLLITIVITNNLHNSDIPDFGELFHNCIELLWWAGNKDNNNRLKLIFQSVFSAILNADGVLGVLVSGIHGRCLKRILFDFNMIVQIEQEKLLKAVDIVAALVEKCSEHENDSSRLSVYKACTALLKSLRSHQNLEEILLVNRKNSLPPMLDDMVKLDEESRTHHWNRKRATSNLHNNLVLLSTEDEQHLAKLGMSRLQKLSDLPHFLRDLERKKINSIQVLMEFLPCASCHKQALVYFSPNKYFLEEEPVPSDFLYRLPFEFNDGDRLGPWDILLSENTIKDLQKLEPTPEVVRAVMKKLGHISSGKWDNYELRCTVRTSTIPVYEVALPDNDLKILWQVDYGFSIRKNSLTQLIKIWAVTDIKERIDKILETLSIVHQVHTSKHLCVVKQTDR